MNRVTFHCGIMTLGYNSTFNYDPGSKFHVEWWPWVWISHWILIPILGLNLTLNHDSGSKFNVEFRPGVIIQCGIKTRGHNSTGVQILSVGGVVIQWPPVSGVAIQHEKSVESWAQPVESRPHGSKFNGVKIQSYTGTAIARQPLLISLTTALTITHSLLISSFRPPRSGSLNFGNTVVGRGLFTGELRATCKGENRDLTQSYDKRPLHSQKNSKRKVTTQKMPPKTLHYDCGPT